MALTAAILQAEERMHRVKSFMGIGALVQNMEKQLEDRKSIDRKAG